MAEAHELAALFIEQPKTERAQTGQQRDRLYFLEERIGVVTALQIVIWNARAEVVNVVKANVAGEPLQDFREFVKRTSVQSRACEIQTQAALQINVLELMLHVKQPAPRPAGDGKDY